MLSGREYPLNVIWNRLSPVRYLEEIILYALSDNIIPIRYLIRLSPMRYLEEIILYALSGRDYPLCVIWKRLSPMRYLEEIILYSLSGRDIIYALSGSETFHELACFCLH